MLLTLLGARPGLAQDPSAEWRVTHSEVLIEGGGRLAWTRRGDLLAFDRLGTDDRFDVWTRDMVSGSERCLTCRVGVWRRANVLNPAWLPSGEWLIVQVQEHAHRLGLGTQGLLGPERSLFSELWLVRADGESIFQLTRVTERGAAVLDAHASPEGDRLVFSQRTRSREGHYGEWQLVTARLRIRRGVPRLFELRAALDDQVDGLVIAQGFLPDATRVLVAAERADGDAIGLSIWDPRARSLTWLSQPREGRDEFARVSPRDPWIAFASDLPRPAPGPAGPRGDGSTLDAREVFVMALDGDHKAQLSQFNGAGGMGLGRVWVGDLEWSPDGKRLAAQVVYGIAEAHPAIVLMELERTLPTVVPTVTLFPGQATAAE